MCVLWPAWQAEVNWCKVCVRWLRLITAHKFNSPLTPPPFSTPCILGSKIIWGFQQLTYTYLRNVWFYLGAISFRLLVTSPWSVQIVNWIFSWKGSDLPQSQRSAVQSVSEGHTKSLSTPIWQDPQIPQRPRRFIMYTPGIRNSTKNMFDDSMGDIVIVEKSESAKVQLYRF